MSVLHFDPFSGLSGDMFLGACVDLGMPLEVVSEAVARLGVPSLGVEAVAGHRGGIAGTYFAVTDGGRSAEEVAHHPSDRHPHRGLAEIRRLLGDSGLDAAVRERALLFFARLAEAESLAHGAPIETVHFHEVGALDSIADLVGAAAAMEHLRPERITCGTVNLGSGTVSTAHGELPVPAPATARLVQGLPVRGGPGGELLTPTGAVLLAELVDSFEEMPALVVTGVGLGLGSREIEGRPNAFRLWSGERSREQGEVLVVECEVDDLPGEAFGFMMERLLEAGALDVYYTPVQMKKSRPGVLITLLCRRPQLEDLASRLLAESGSLGCRYYPAGRLEAERETVAVETTFGEVRVKRARFRGRELAQSPEYEDCRRLALAAGVSWREVHLAASLAAQRGD